ncbi:MAG: adenylyl-sulfate kinase [Thermaurantimonas sp.]
MSREAKVIWMTGLSGAGKSTLAYAVSSYFRGIHKPCVVLDGDVLRRGINKDLGFSESDRFENIRRAACVADLVRSQGIWCIASLITPTNQLRRLAAQTIGADHFRLIYVKAPLETCISRDPKNLYKKAMKGEINDFTGISAPFEEPAHADLIIDTSCEDAEKCAKRLIHYVEREF